jgi:hypothetical protein
VPGLGEGVLLVRIKIAGLRKGAPGRRLRHSSGAPIEDPMATSGTTLGNQVVALTQKRPPVRFAAFG